MQEEVWGEKGSGIHGCTTSLQYTRLYYLGNCRDWKTTEQDGRGARNSQGNQRRMYRSAVLGELLWLSVGTLGEVSSLLGYGWGSPTVSQDEDPLVVL